MPTAENGKLEYEAGQNVTAMSELTDSGDHKNYTSAASLWSRKSGYEPKLYPNGLATGGAVTPAAAAGNDDVDVAALTCYLAGVLTTVSAATDQAITRPATAVSKVNSITVTSGGTIAVVAGTDGSDTSFVETRGAAGGPPYIPVGDIEIAQVRVTSDTSAVIAASEIKSVIGQHVERWDYPIFTPNYADAELDFASALPLIHTGDLPKKVFAEYADPIFAEATDSYDYVPPETTHSVSSTQVYGRTSASTSSTLNQGSFSKLTDDGITDPLAKLKNEFLWFKFFPDRNKLPHRFDQGKLGISRSYPAGNNMVISCTVSAENVGKEVES